MGDALNIPTVPVQVRGQVLHIAPLTLAQVGPFIAASRSLIGRALAVIAYARAGGQVETGALLLDLLEQDSQAVAGALSVVTGRDVDWIAAASLGEILDMVGAVVDLNQDFFGQRLPALLSRAAQALPETTNPMPGGIDTPLPPSSTSSPTATPTTE